MIVDGHCHAGRGDGLTGPHDSAAPLESYLRRADAAGIERTVIFATFHSDYATANREIAAIVASRPHRFYGFAFVHPQRDAGRIRALVRLAVLEYGFRGIKAHRHDGNLTREVCEVARELRIPVLYDPMGQVEVFELYAREYPDVNFVIPHLGSFADEWAAQLSCIDLIARHPNLYADSAGVRRFDLLAEAARRAGAHKLIFGSDGPWLHPGLELAKIRALCRSSEETRLMLGGNLLRLLEGDRRLSRRAASAPPFRRVSGARPHVGAGAHGR